MPEHPNFAPAELEEAAPLIYTNWTNFNADKELSRTIEFGVFADARIIGQSKFGPYDFLNTLASAVGNGSLTQAIVVRSVCHWPEYGFKPMYKTQDSHYHGGDHPDELAALISLILGIRAQAGSITREFMLHGDPYGSPTTIGSKPIPILPPLYISPRIPRLRSEYNLDELEPITILPRVNAETASVIVKVARMYQQAVWLVDAQPSMSWLLLVSAIETAANYWALQKHIISDDYTLPEELNEIIAEHSCSSSIVEPLSKYMEKYTKATTKFVKFIQEFLPDPPESRPEAAYCIEFTKNGLKKGLEKIYDYRSRALHDGISFPYPMCNAPSHYHEEMPMGATRAQNGIWSKEDMPMLLHIFEHIVRGSILNWLQSLC